MGLASRTDHMFGRPHETAADVVELAWTKKKTTRRERFLAERDKVIPWRQLVKLIRAH